jgi:hypothetical protein
VKTTVSDEWTGSCDATNDTCERLLPDNLWNEHRFFDSKSEAKFFLGVLDATFLAAYSIVTTLSTLFKPKLKIETKKKQNPQGPIHKRHFGRQVRLETGAHVWHDSLGN